MKELAISTMAAMLTLSSAALGLEVGTSGGVNGGVAATTGTITVAQRNPSAKKMHDPSNRGQARMARRFKTKANRSR